MKTRFFISVLLVSALPAFCACSDGTQMPDWPWDEPQKPETPEEPGENPGENPGEEPEDTDWTDVSADYEGLPSYITILRSPSTLQDKAAVAYAAIADMSKASLDIWSVKDPTLSGADESLKTPSKVYEAEKPAVIINGGYFYVDGGKTYPMSLAVKDGEILAQNINYSSQDWVKIYYPTRAALLLDATGKAKAAWTYYSNADGKTYVYPQPAQNSWDSKPLQVPSATFPEGAKVMDAKWAVGGGPVLLRDGEVVNSYGPELFLSDVGCDVNNPRTAVGVTADNKAVFFVCEGRNMTEGVKGLTTVEVAAVMKDLGCTEAINLDGGGSSCMLVGGRETIKPSDGAQRSVACTLMLK